MTLTQLFSVFGKIHWRQARAEELVRGVFSDSRKVIPGTVFVAAAGVSSDGHDFIPKAIAQGAVALVVERIDTVPDSYKGAVLQVLDSKWTLAELLRRYYGDPEDSLISLAVTGTNGKTSTAYLVEALLNEASVACGVMGTIDHHFQQQIWKSQLTTPDTATFYERLKQFADAGAQAYVMEVSSHALKQKRVPTLFDVAIFTNFTRDHLDYHGTMEDYLASKQKLFSDHFKKEDTFAVLNADDRAVAATVVPSGVQRLTFGESASDFQFRVESSTVEGTQFEVEEKSRGRYKYWTPMVGLHNVANAVGAIAAARCLGITHEICQRALERFSGVPGRLQRVPNTKERHVFIDYAHTPDALEKILSSLRRLLNAQSQGRLITVFGCGGDRDQGKRPLMREVAERYSDQVIVTSDNPRHEDPQSIIDQILAGAKNPHLLSEVDRAKALRRAVDISQAGDVIVIAGKGHEDYQIIGSQVLPFSDYEKMREFCQ